MMDGKAMPRGEIESLDLPFDKAVQRAVNAPAKDKLKCKANGVLHCGDCISIMNDMDAESVKIVVTSPPYNIKNSTGNGLKDGRGGKWEKATLQKGYDTHEDAMEHDD